MNKKYGKRILLCLWIILVFGTFGCGGQQTSGSAHDEQVDIVDLTVEYRENPLGIDEEMPVFSWRMESTQRGKEQKSYRLCAADSPENLETENFCWDTGKIDSDLSAAIPYEGETLQPMTRYYWRVTVWDEEDKEVSSKETAWFETGLLGTGWDGAKWIGKENLQEEMASEPQLAENSKYSIEYDFQGAQNAEIGIVFGADSDRYGEYYAWIVGIEEEKVCLKMCRMDDYCTQEAEYSWLDAFYSPQDFLEKQVHVKIEIDGNQTVTYMDGSKVADFELPVEKDPGRIGTYGDRTDAIAYIDNILVLDENGQEVYSENFESEKTIFSPEYIGVSEGRGCVKAGVTLVPGTRKSAPYLRKKFETETEDIISARLYASALGIYQIWVNEENVSDHFFDPGQMVYDKELNYCTYDVTDLLERGENRIQVCLGHGWYDRALGTMDNWAAWGESAPAFLAKIEIRYADGTTQTIVSDESWEVSQDGPILGNDMYQGEIYDASRENTEWNWETADTDYVDEKFRHSVFKAHVRERVRNTNVLQPVAVTNPKPGTYVYDFGQEFSGVCRIRVKGQAGECITLRHAEALNTENLTNKDDIPGTIWTRNLMTAGNIDYYFLKGEEEENYAPSMVCRAFRYVQISGLDEDTQLAGVEGLVLMSDLEETGSFESSDIWLNRLYHNVFWSQRSNFVDVPTDCPQRDERFGWSGDIGAFSSTAVYNMNTRSFLADYLDWLRLQQQENGAVSDMAPHISTQDSGNNGWGDALVLITWELYQQYADKKLVEENFDAMCAWVDYLVDTSENGLRTREKSYGDHLQYHSTPQQMTDTAQSAYSALLVSKMAGLLENRKAEEKYRAVYEMFRKGWQETWLEENGLLKDGTQTAYALGLRFGLYPEELKEAGEEFLLACVQWIDHHPSSGYVGMPHLLPALSEAGYGKDAYQLLLQKTAPSWNYGITLGATTIPESWTGYTGYEDGSYSLHGSLNHYALGSVGEWFYSDILGIGPVEENPGFKQIRLEPQITDLIQYAGGSYDSVYGRIESRWENMEDGYCYRVTVPANTSAVLCLPAVPGAGEPLKTDKITENNTALEQTDGITVIGQQGNGVLINLVSGTYEFRVLR